MESTRSKKKVIWGAVLAVIALLAIFAVGKYNTLVQSNEGVNNKWAQIGTQLQRRYDLIPNLVNTVKGNTQQEKDVFIALANARSRYAGATTQEGQVAAANETESALARLLVISENYPTLSSSVAFQNLQVELEGSENRIAVARKDYNDVVTTFNTKVKYFPGSLLARMFGFAPRSYFENSDASNEVPTVEFNN